MISDFDVNFIIPISRKMTKQKSEPKKYNVEGWFYWVSNYLQSDLSDFEKMKIVDKTIYIKIEGADKVKTEHKIFHKNTKILSNKQIIKCFPNSRKFLVSKKFP